MADGAAALTDEESAALTSAVENGEPDVLRQKLAERPDALTVCPWGDAGSLLHLAAEAGHTDVAQALLDLGASVSTVDDDLQTPLHVAAMNGHTGLVTMLMAASLRVMGGSECRELTLDDKYQMTPFHL
eukprot:5926299-Prymnesium_polylepis.1